MTDERNSLKHHFLKQFIFRIDFRNVMEEDIRKCLSDLRSFYYEQGYTSLTEMYTNSANLAISSNSNNSNIPFEFKDVEKHKLWRFTKDNSNDCFLEISSQFFAITENIVSVYSTFDQYRTIIEKTINALKNSSAFFVCNRIGIRKINVGYIEDLSLLSKFFRAEILNAAALQSAFDGYEYMASNFNNLLMSSEIKTNYIRNIQSGTATDDAGISTQIYQIVLDIDSFVDSVNNETISDISDLNTLITKINSTTFDIYKKSLTTEFLDDLKKEEFTEKEFKGVV